MWHLFFRENAQRRSFLLSKVTEKKHHNENDTDLEYEYLTGILCFPATIRVIDLIGVVMPKLTISLKGKTQRLAFVEMVESGR